MIVSVQCSQVECADTVPTHITWPSLAFIQRQRWGSKLTKRKWSGIEQVDVWGNIRTTVKPPPWLWTTLRHRAKGGGGGHRTPSIPVGARGRGICLELQGTAGLWSKREHPFSVYVKVLAVCKVTIDKVRALSFILKTPCEGKDIGIAVLRAFRNWGSISSQWHYLPCLAHHTWPCFKHPSAHPQPPPLLQVLVFLQTIFNQEASLDQPNSSHFSHTSPPITFTVCVIHLDLSFITVGDINIFHTYIHRYIFIQIYVYMHAYTYIHLSSDYKIEEGRDYVWFVTSVTQSI